jgi:hypothetical protein
VGWAFFSYGFLHRLAILLPNLSLDSYKVSGFPVQPDEIKGHQIAMAILQHLKQPDGIAHRSASCA